MSPEELVADAATEGGGDKNMSPHEWACVRAEEAYKEAVQALDSIAPPVAALAAESGRVNATADALTVEFDAVKNSVSKAREAELALQTEDFVLGTSENTVRQQIRQLEAKLKDTAYRRAIVQDQRKVQEETLLVLQGRLRETEGLTQERATVLSQLPSLRMKRA